MAPMAADTAHKHISLDGNISALASVLLMAPYFNSFITNFMDDKVYRGPLLLLGS